MRAEGSRHDRDYTGEVKLLNAMSAFPQKRTFVVAGPFTFYGGDFFAAERSEWDLETLEEQRWDAERAVRRFEEANRIMVTS